MKGFGVYTCMWTLSRDANGASRRLWKANVLEIETQRCVVYAAS
ncbi:hypothetical protein ROLI_027090 [Roseobacter fucihabitans]|uniref:Uncharacterized protein n=1 Tax=Roseobacter fucihabitans TaxID=1537242 RepID=A0ABZ2BY08_9RHOB|nr:hypothetical protein [Roseobacter litoralis]